jgi:hypothetical protein
MPDTPNLRPATRDELTQSRSFALRLNGRKRVHDADETMARVTAERLVEHLERSGYVVMHKPPLGRHGTPRNLADWIEKAVKSNACQTPTERASGRHASSKTATDSGTLCC